MATRILLCISFLDMLGAGLLMAQLANHARQLGCNQIQIGTMSALYSASQLISGPVTGILSDIKGRKLTLLLCLYTCAFAYASLGITSSIILFLLLRSLIGIFKQTQLLTNALAPDYEKDGTKQSIMYGRISTMIGLGMSVGPIISGHIMEAYPNNGFTVICFTIGALFIFNTFLVKMLPDVKSPKPTINRENIAPNFIDSIAKTAQEAVNEVREIDWSIFWDMYLFKIIVTCCIGLYFNSFGLFLKTYHNASPKQLGYLISFQGGMNSIFTYFIGHITKFYRNDKDFSLRMQHVLIGLALTMLGMSTSPSILVYGLLLIPLALCSATGRVTTLEMIASRSKSKNRGALIGASNSTKSLSGVITPLVAGFIGEYFGIACNLYLASLLAASGAIIVSYYIRNNTTKNKKDE